MNFDFSDDQKMIQTQARKFLDEQCASAVIRSVLERDINTTKSYSENLWAGIKDLGWAGVSIPEEYGGLGLGYLELCVIAEELGRSLAPVPFSSSLYLGAEALMLAGTEAQKQQWLPRIASGEVIVSFAYAETVAGVGVFKSQVSVQQGLLSGVKSPVVDGDVAGLLIVTAQDESGTENLYLVDAVSEGIELNSLSSIDPTRPIAQVTFNNAPVEAMRPDIEGAEIRKQVLDRAAILFAFEQVGGSQACLDMAKDYTMQRYAFGRPIASFQSMKNKLVDMYVAIELARSNAYYGAWALSSASDSSGSDKLTEAAAVARISATSAYYECSKENMQAHGGMGFTWELDCHLYYRRAQFIASILGSQSYWKDRLIGEVA